MRPPKGSLAMLACLLVADLAPAAFAANVCGETVAANRIIDGIPAYSQCSAASGSAIYSNNGVDTATSSGGTGWVRTQMSGGYQCTELAHRYLYFRWNVQSVPNGNAGVWCDGNIPSGLVKSTTPVHGDLIVFAPGSCGADATTGHVAVVDVVNANATVTFVEQNQANRRSCAISTAACFLHAVANEGTGADGGTADGAIPDASPVGDVATDRGRRDLPGSGGVTSSGGTTGTGGTTSGDGTGGSAGTGGVAATGGTVASGGSSGRGGDGGGGATGLGPGEAASGGCSCGLADGQRIRGSLIVLALVGLVVARRRRRG